MKALKNFSCNGVRKKKGDSISSEEMQKMGDAGKKMQSEDYISNAGSEKPSPGPSENPQPKASKKKVSKKS